MPMIKLYSKRCLSIKCKDQRDILESINELIKEYIVHEIQVPSYRVQRTKRKLKPFNVDFSYYEIDTIKEIINDKFGD